MNTLAVHHFGPDRTTVGGMATVIRLLSEHNVGADTVNCYATWRPQSRVANAPLVAHATQALLRIPTSHIVHVHLSERGSFLREGALVALARQRGLTTAVTIHGASFASFASQHPRLVSSVLNRAHLITCLDSKVLELVKVHAPRAISVLVPNPVVVDTSLSAIPETSEMVVFAGEIGLRKGADVLHRAWQDVATRRPDARCLMIGPVADFTPPPADRLEVRTPVNPVKMRELLRTGRVVALPSRAEGMPMILAEAMSLGRPFVSTPVGGIPELGGGGILVDVEDASGLADRLTELLADSALARTIGERGWKLCVETRSIGVIGARLRSLYLDAAQQARNG